MASNFKSTRLIDNLVAEVLTKVKMMKFKTKKPNDIEALANEESCNGVLKNICTMTKASIEYVINCQAFGSNAPPVFEKVEDKHLHLID